ncbi:hypothetical protein HC031_20075 [Planosporangium thailandense]|uniref:Peptidase C45 hydrolase domain-containing protein n=1 Tax=Planosporangium thailandense TaxID=765197 RepID=A0ABX0Y1N9_9ACTN|nr:C45 family peptidase [Planosporangium thailandense]NJC71996.1 hypothetical protein [Planosporangium thailandense]
MGTIGVITVPADPQAGARTLAVATAARLDAALTTYEALFAGAGVRTGEVRRWADSSRAALTEWAPDLVEEIEAYADAAGVEAWRLHALNARTEILAAGANARRGECSTVAHAGGDNLLAAQTWDWHVELTGAFDVVRHESARLPFATMTEVGVLGKIGMNAAGVGLLVNILGHRSDAARPGVPVHALARRVLDTATSLEHALAIIGEAPLAASTCFTVVSPQGIACVEASPAGVARAPQVGDWVVHTNHFVDDVLSAGDTRVGLEPDSVDRYHLLARCVARTSGPVRADTLVGLLRAHDVDGGPVCCHAPQGGPLGSRWATLATVVLDPVAATMGVAGSRPCDIGVDSWTTFTFSCGARERSPDW